MYVESNDLFFSTIEAGVDLFPNGEALSGDITNQVVLLDAGTEINQPIGFGADQAPRQSAFNIGEPDIENNVRLNTDDSASLLINTIRVVVTNDGVNNFTINIQNLPSSTTPLSPGVFAVFNGGNPIFRLEKRT